MVTLIYMFFHTFCIKSLRSPFKHGCLRTSNKIKSLNVLIGICSEVNKKALIPNINLILYPLHIRTPFPQYNMQDYKNSKFRRLRRQSMNYYYDVGSGSVNTEQTVRSPNGRSVRFIINLEVAIQYCIL